MNRVLLRLVLLGAIGAVGAVAAPADALAQTAPSADKKQAAKQFVDAGLAAQSAGDYDKAIALYSKAYELVPHPTLIFNLAQAHRLAGHIEQSLALYRRYLAEDPRGPHATTARELVSEIEGRKADDARKADAARKANEAHGPDGARKPDAAARTDEAHKPDAARKPNEAHGPDGARKPDAAARNDEARKPDPARKPNEAPDAAASKPDGARKPDAAASKS